MTNSQCMITTWRCSASRRVGSHVRLNVRKWHISEEAGSVDQVRSMRCSGSAPCGPETTRLTRNGPVLDWGLLLTVSEIAKLNRQCSMREGAILWRGETRSDGGCADCG